MQGCTCGWLNTVGAKLARDGVSAGPSRASFAPTAFTPHLCSSNCLGTASSASRLKSAPTPSVVGAGLGRDAHDAVFLYYGADAIASKLCSHSGAAYIGGCFHTVGAKLAREGPPGCSHSVRRPSVAAEGCVTGDAVCQPVGGVRDAAWRPLLQVAQHHRISHRLLHKKAPAASLQRGLFHAFKIRRTACARAVLLRRGAGAR